MGCGKENGNLFFRGSQWSDQFGEIPSGWNLFGIRKLWYQNQDLWYSLEETPPTLRCPLRLCQLYCFPSNRVVSIISLHRCQGQDLGFEIREISIYFVQSWWQCFELQFLRGWRLLCHWRRWHNGNALEIQFYWFRNRVVWRRVYAQVKIWEKNTKLLSKWKVILLLIQALKI